MPKKLTTKEFIQRSIKIHKGLYDYSLSDYKGNLTKIKIICPIHGVFEQLPKNHLKGANCNFCANKSRSKAGNSNKTLTTNVFIERSKEIHNNKYDYSLVNYSTVKIPIKIICPVHGEFKQKPKEHLSGNGCKECMYDLKRLDTDNFIKHSRNMHDNKYIYSATTYSGSFEKVIITCPKHGNFKQSAYTHKQGGGCSSCNDSKGEREIKQFLKKQNINFISQKKFDGCKNKRHLVFDFYLPDHNLCVEYDGIQHFQEIKYFGGKKTFNNQLKKDKIKNEYCKKNNIKLLRINYKEDIKFCLNKFLI